MGASSHAVRSGLLDDLARALAEPMPRRRVLRLFGGVIVAAAVPGSALARPRRRGALCVAGETVCQTSPTKYTCCNEFNPVCCKSPSALLCCKEGCSCGTDARGYPDCVRCPRCAKGFQECGKSGCCEPGKVCASTSGDVLCCRRGEAGCGSRCCARGLRCADPKKETCSPCPKGQQACGEKCCPKGKTCCDSRKGLCCDKKGATCCDQGEAGRALWICCNAPRRCLRYADVPKVSRCCPEDRIVEPVAGSQYCCPVTHVSIGGKPGKTGKECCPRSKVCGSGKNVTCCTSGTVADLDANQRCCGGRCVNYNIDPRNCGACGEVCASGLCIDGACA